MNNKTYTVIFLLVIFCSSCKDGKERIYYTNGKLKSEYEMANDKRQGIFTEYYEDGAVKQIGSYREGKKQGKHIAYNADGSVAQIFYYTKGKRDGIAKIYYPSGELREVQKYNDGRLVDYEKYKNDGSRVDKMMGLAYLEKDTVEINDTVSVTFKLGNVSNKAYNHGALIITSDWTPKGNPMDTIYMTESDINEYRYTFQASSMGLQKIKGCLVYLIQLDTADAILFEQYTFEEPYYVASRR